MGTNGNHRSSSATPHQPCRRVLVVEPEALLRWSIVTYLSRWCNVLQVDSQAGADRMLDGQAFDALVVSDQLPAEQGQQVESRALARNPSVRIVHIGIGPTDASERAYQGAFVEKPFELARLAELLGIGTTTAKP